MLLNDVFIYPDMEHINSNSTIKYKQIQSNKIIDKFDYAYIIGSDKSGKTALLKKYCNDLIDLGYQVVALKAEEIKHFSAEQLVKICSSKFGIKYDSNQSNFVLLIDDFQSLKISERYENNFLDSISNFFKKIYFFVDKQHFFGDRSKHLNIKFEIFEIKNLGHLKRNELYSKWYSIGVESLYIQNDSDFLKKIDNLTNHFDLLLRKNVMDAKPMYILTIIQTLDNINLSRDFSLTSYGHCYNSLILSLLQKIRVNHNDFDGILNFLSFLAYEMFTKKIKSISEEDFDILLNEYYKEYVISLDIKNILMDANIIYLDDNLDLIFSQKYIYYFSCSKYIAANQSNLSSVVKNLCETIHTEESANILIFLVHHSNSTDFLDYILEYSSSLLEDFQPHYLTINQNTILNEKFRKILSKEIAQISLLNKNIYEERSKSLALRDQTEEPDTILDSAINSFEDSKDELKEELEQSAELKQINDSSTIFRCLEVLGQIAKNKHGSFNRTRLENLLDSSYGLGLKSLSFFLDILMKSDNELKEFMISIIQEKNKTSEEEALSIAEKMIFEMCRSVCRYLINFIAKATASPQLDQIINDLLLKNSNPAYQLIFIQTQLQLGRIPKREIKVLYENENEKNMIVTTLLQNMVLNYIYMNKIDFSEKKWISANLKIPMNSQYNKVPENSLIKTVL
ncbi:MULTISPECIES: toll/interleukin-1 receptor domain-containing protein [Acinetobacter]|uniref:toll/interleukin-1 receptor domain-containing protein n=1 Tax=Acinetobacter TaxID=469 RepID=UPI0015B7744B|nr:MULTISPECIES: toll/interleukin-1 receptor domain-containing protein [Acinetobacter]MBT0888435.1 toll/interleukin-1 receptor domain-containing protein [Acinetobacter towneri]NWJ93840.1 toll/interleukin-1 receptor domain-containing protein [Acinetobacter sp. Swhac1]